MSYYYYKTEAPIKTVRYTFPSKFFFAANTNSTSFALETWPDLELGCNLGATLRCTAAGGTLNLKEKIGEEVFMK